LKREDDEVLDLRDWKARLLELVIFGYSVEVQNGGAEPKLNTEP